MPAHTPGAIGSAGDNDQGPQQTNLAVQFPNSVDALPGMQFPDPPGGADSNARRSGQQMIIDPAGAPGEHFGTYAVVAHRDPTFGAYNANPTVLVGTNPSPVPDMPQYGKVLGTTLYEAAPEE